MAPHHPSLALALGSCRSTLERALDVRPARLLVACSGGPDSVALLGLANLLQRALQIELVVGHVDHGLRPEAGAEAEAVQALAARLGLSCERTRVDLSPGSGLPARARVARRAALGEQRRRVGAVAILLGHTATDQTETMIMHLVRGCGLDGIAAMPPIDAPWVRPLLDLTRAQTREVAERLELPFVDDPTNDDPKHFRVGIRTQMLPRLRAENPRLERAFVSTAEQARDAEQALEGWAQRECAARARAGRRWDICGFEQLPRAVRTRMVRAMCREGGVDIGALTHQIVDAIEAAALRRASKRWDLHPNQRLFLEKDEIRVEPAQGHL